MERQPRPLYILSVLGNKCPRCREGQLFVSSNPYAMRGQRFLKMHDHCPACGQETDIEVGFYYGTGYVSYGLVVGFSLALAFVWWWLFGFSVNDNSIFWYLGVNCFLMIALQPPMMRFSRTLWLSWFVSYDPEWRTRKPARGERVVPEQMHNW